MKSVVVLGIRSGTSMLAMMLDALGIYMGKNFIDSTTFNERGYFEEIDFNDVNQEIFNNLGVGRWVNQMKPDDIQRIPMPLFSKVKSVIEKHEKEPIWGFKQPMTSFLIPIYDQLLKEPHYIIMTRSTEEQAYSIHRMEGASYPNLNISDFEKAIKGFMDNAMNYTEGKKRLIIEYDDVLKKPASILAEIVHFLDIKPSKVQIEKALSLVDPKLRTYKEVKQ